VNKILWLIGVGLGAACVFMFGSPAFAAQREGFIPSDTGGSETRVLAEKL